ncbi:MAG TPA: transporter associated domain-containing protein [Trebonia sp.]|nr:transporter associated domain-containing protein [Trebonia sp.]
MLAALGELPTPGDAVEIPGYTIAVTEMDGRRIARLLVTPHPEPAPEPTAEPAQAAAVTKSGDEQA